MDEPLWEENLGLDDVPVVRFDYMENIQANPEVNYMSNSNMVGKSENKEKFKCVHNIWSF